MKLAVISDIHGNSDALAATLDDIRGREIGTVVNLGDCFSGPFDAASTARLLRQNDVTTISGNHDRALWEGPREDMGLWEDWIIDDLSADDLDWLRALPKTLTVGDVYLCHATPDNDEENWLDHRGSPTRLIARDLNEVQARLGGVTAPVVCCGHTHTPRVVRLPSGQMIVNPGSVGCPAYYDTRVEPHFIHETGSPDARYAILEETASGWRADLVSVPYDSRRMAALARQRGAESWARAVEVGWITGEV